MRKCFAMFVMCVWVMCFAVDSAFCLDSYEEREVLYISSYNAGLKWADDMYAGVKEGLEGLPHLDLIVEYLDTKRFDTEEYYDFLKKEFQFKYSGLNLDLVITSDDNALNFVKKNRDALFRDVPVVFCGANYLEEQDIQGFDRMVGISEYAELDKGFDIALKLFPDTKDIYVVVDDTTTGKILKAEVDREADRLEPEVRFHYLDGMSKPELLSVSANLSKGSIMFFLVFDRDKDGVYLKSDEVLAELATVTRVPIFGIGDTTLGMGVVGGYMTSAYYQGLGAGLLARGILQGEPVESLPRVGKSPNRYMFDYEQMTRLGIAPRNLPEGSQLVNTPVSIYAKYKKTIWLVIAAFAAMLVCLILMVINIIKRRKAQQELISSHDELLSLFDNSQIGVALLGENRTILMANSKLARIFGFDLPRDMYGMNTSDIHVSEESYREFGIKYMPALVQGEGVTVEYPMRNKRGEKIWTVLYGRSVDSASPPDLSRGFVWMVNDITDKKRMENELQAMSLVDSLTGLANRALALDRISHAQKRMKRNTGKFFCLFFLNLDRFKTINDSFSHAFGDHVLRETADRIRRSIRDVDTLARIGSDEFLILMEDLESMRMPVRIIRRIQKEIREPYLFLGKQVNLSASIGVESSPSPAAKPEELIRNANLAMYYAKNKGGDRFKVFTPKLEHQALTRLMLENDMDAGIADDDFFLVYQPIYSIKKDRELYGFEVLCRWDHPDKGMIMPSDFIPVAEDTGKIVALGAWVLETACQRYVQWRKDFPALSSLVLSVNVSVLQLQRGDFVSTVKRILRETGISPDSLRLEMTESALMYDGMSHVGKLKELRQLGVKVSVDDFGTGYSCMAYLTQLPLDNLKIDFRFVKNLGTSPEYLKIVEAIVNLAHNLGLQVVAEGVETESQLEILREINCEYGQGFLLSRPLKEDRARKLLAEACRLPE